MSGELFPQNRSSNLDFKDLGEMANLVGQKMASYPRFYTNQYGPLFKTVVKWEAWTVSVTSSSEQRSLYAARELLAYKLLDTELCHIFWHKELKKYYGTFRPFALYERMKIPMTQHYNTSYSLAPQGCPGRDDTDGIPDFGPGQLPQVVNPGANMTYAVGTDTGESTITLKYI